MYAKKEMAPQRNSPMRGPKYSFSALLSVLSVQGVPSQPSYGTSLAHQLNSVSVHWMAKKIMMPEMAIPQDHAAESTKLYYRQG